MAQSFLSDVKSSGPLADLDNVSVNKTMGHEFHGASNSLDIVHLSFPEQLLEIDHWMTFRAFETSQLSRKTESTKKPKCFITLPIPGNLQVAYNIHYTEADLGAVNRTIIDALGKGDEADKARSLIEASVVGVASGAALGAVTSGVSAALGAGLGGIAGLSTEPEGRAVIASSIIAGLNTLGEAGIAQFGIARNPHKVLLFESVGFRTHTFSYQFVPQSYNEADLIRQIIRAFKLFSSPSLDGKIKINDSTTLNGGKHFFKYPEYFEIDFHHPRFLFSIGPSVLESVEVNYQPSGMPTYSRETGQKDPTPTGINISLSFKETEIVTKENILSENR